MKNYLFITCVLVFIISCNSGEPSNAELTENLIKIKMELIVNYRKKVTYGRFSYYRHKGAPSYRNFVKNEIGPILKEFYNADNSLDSATDIESWEKAIELQLSPIDRLKKLKEKEKEKESMYSHEEKLNKMLIGREEFLESLKSLKTLLNNKFILKRYKGKSKDSVEFKIFIDDFIKTFKLKISDHRTKDEKIIKAI